MTSLALARNCDLRSFPTPRTQKAIKTLSKNLVFNWVSSILMEAMNAPSRYTNLFLFFFFDNYHFSTNNRARPLPTYYRPPTPLLVLTMVSKRQLCNPISDPYQLVRHQISFKNVTFKAIKSNPKREMKRFGCGKRKSRLFELRWMITTQNTTEKSTWQD